MIAWIPLGKAAVYGVNSTRKSMKFRRNFPSGECGFDGHAETICIHNALKKTQSVKGKDLWVMRFRRNGTIGMAKPCIPCQEAIRSVGIRRVHYTNDSGHWEIMKM